MNTETNRPPDEADSLSRPVSERDHASAKLSYVERGGSARSI